ncbi:V-set and immunoglobulin domain-containing protein 1-like [Anguilla anguilla]|uniref:V-set and immunoglobulin domain-containing protein 1-like n=1 Tax=Anguilla anguilla TaxID=7936 RepID=UPI0015B25C13|nr:V-set and immunoglobulin domain-containing protein 1-like [Anguilla anguilla]
MLSSQLSLAMLFCFMGCANSITVQTPQKAVNVTSGGSVFLGCTFSTSQPTTNLNIQWSYNPKSSMVPQQIYYYISGKAVIQADFAGRITEPAFPNITKNASIVISGMKPSDSGVYSCVVHNFPDAEGQTEGNINVNVLEKPSNPFCAVHGTVESGHLVTLTCHTERGNPTPTYTWTKLNQGKARSVLGRTDFHTGVLYIGNLSQFEFGEYQCNASNVVGFSTCSIKLVEELGDGAIAGAVIGSLLGAGLVVFLVWFISHKLKKSKYKAAKAAAATEMQARPASGDSLKYASLPTRDSAAQASTKAVSPPQDPPAPDQEGEEEEEQEREGPAHA